VSRRRPAPQDVGAFVCLLLLVAGCSSGAVDLGPARLDGAAAERCADLVAALPDAVADQSRREVAPSDALGAAWGDPAIVLRCGVPRPAGFDPKFGTCQTVNGVDWYIPEDQITGRPADIVMTTVGRAENVEVRVPEEYFPPAAAMVDLAAAIKATVPVVRACV
jgi:hypothetical protein